MRRALLAPRTNRVRERVRSQRLVPGTVEVPPLESHPATGEDIASVASRGQSYRLSGPSDPALRVRQPSGRTRCCRTSRFVTTLAAGGLSDRSRRHGLSPLAFRGFSWLGRAAHKPIYQTAVGCHDLRTVDGHFVRSRDAQADAILRQPRHDDRNPARGQHDFFADLPAKQQHWFLHESYAVLDVGS